MISRMDGEVFERKLGESFDDSFGERERERENERESFRSGSCLNSGREKRRTSLQNLSLHQDHDDQNIGARKVLLI